MSLIRTLALGTTLALTPVADAQTWVATQQSPESESFIPKLSLAQDGRLAVLRHSGINRAEISIISPTGDLLSSFDVLPFSGLYSIINDLEFLDDDSIAICGEVNDRPYIASLDINTGTTEWDRSIGMEGELGELMIDSDGNLMALGEDKFNDTFITSVTPEGAKIWDRHYTMTAHSDHPRNLTPSPDGKVYISGFAGAYAWITCMANDGQVEWSSTYKTSTASMQFNGLAVAPNGELLLAGLNYSSTLRRNIALRLTPAGDVIWSKLYALPGENLVKFGSYGIQSTKFGGALIGCNLQEPGTSPHQGPGVIKLAPDGTHIWTRSYATPGTTMSPPNFIITPDDGLFQAFSAGSGTSQVIRSNAQGDAGDCVNGYASTFTSNITVQRTDIVVSHLNFSSLPVQAHTTPAPNTMTFTIECATDCYVTGGSFGQGLAGTAGITPRISIDDGICLSYGAKLNLTNGPGASPALIAISGGQTNAPFLGGTLYLDLATFSFLPPVFLGGSSGIPGSGSLSIPFETDLSNLAGYQLFAQAFIPDSAAPQGWSMTEAAVMTFQ